jgi:hypothetical protein
VGNLSLTEEKGNATDDAPLAGGQASKARGTGTQEGFQRVGIQAQPTALDSVGFLYRQIARIRVAGF